MNTRRVDIKSLIIGILTAAVFFLFIGAAASPEKINEYQVNSFQEEENLEKWTNEQISKGWKPTGGVAISYIKYSNGEWGVHQAQAMVR